MYSNKRKKVLRARVETGKSWRNETQASGGLFRMAPRSRNETGNQLRIYVSFHVKRTRRALGMFLFPFMKRNNEIRNVRSKFPPISPPNAGKYWHFRPRLRRAVFYFANYAVSKRAFREFSVGMRFLIAADIVNQTLSITLARRAGCEQTKPRAQTMELRKVPRE